MDVILFIIHMCTYAAVIILFAENKKLYKRVHELEAQLNSAEHLKRMRQYRVAWLRTKK